MALNPTDQNYTASWQLEIKKNSDGTYNSAYPAGDKGVGGNIIFQDDFASGDFNGTLNYTHTGLGTITTATLTDSSTNVMSLTSITDASASIPDYGDEVGRVLTGTVTLTLGDGTLTATKTFTLNPKTNYSSVKLTSGFSTGTESFLYNFTGTPAIGDEFHYVTSEITLNANGSWETVDPFEGVTTIYGVDATDGLMESFTHTTGAAASSVITNSITTLSIATGSSL